MSDPAPSTELPLAVTVNAFNILLSDQNVPPSKKRHGTKY